MKSEICNLKWGLVLAVALAAGGPTSVSAADAPAKPETIQEAYQRHRRALQNWTCHTFPDKVLEPVPAAMAWIAETEGKHAGYALEIEDLKTTVLRTLRRGRDFKTGLALAKDLYAHAKGTGNRVEAASYLAMELVDSKKDYAAADKLYVDLLDKLRNVPGHDGNVRNLVAARAYLHTLRNDQAGALAYVESERALVKGEKRFVALMNRCLDEVAIGIYESFFDYAGELAFCRARGNRARQFKLYAEARVSDLPAMAKLSHEIVLDDACDAGLRTQAWLWLFSRDEAFCEKNVSRCFSREARSTNDFIYTVGNVFWQTHLCAPYGKMMPAYARNPAVTVRLWKHYLAAVKLVNKVNDYRPAEYAALAYAELGDKANAAAALDVALGCLKLKPEERFELTLMKRIVGLTGGEDAIEKATRAAVRELRGDLDAKLVKRHVEHACAIATISRDDTLKRGVAKYYLADIRATPEKKRYTVRFSDRNVAGAGDWANLPFRPDESDFDRTYGSGGMEWMTTDVSTGDRGNAVKGGGKARKHPTTLQAVADEWGLHFVFTYYDARARQFESGELNAGSFENYLGPGENTPYVCFMSYPAKDAVTGSAFNTCYDGQGHRHVNVRDPSKFRSDTVFTDDSIVTYAAFSWDNYVDNIPSDGSEWDFESLFWGPVASAWNGTESIHGRSTFGKLRFELSEKARTKILRARLFKVVNAYRAEKLPKQVSPDSVQEGVFSHWSDDELGDVEFYEKELKPLMAELDPVAARVKAGMSDEDVREISAKYLSRFHNIRFEVARLRDAYLAKKLTTK